MENETDLLFREMQPGDKAQMTAFYAALGKESTAFFNVGRGNENRTMDFFSGGRPFHKFYVAETGGVLSGIRTAASPGSASPYATSTGAGISGSLCCVRSKRCLPDRGMADCSYGPRSRISPHGGSTKNAGIRTSGRTLPANCCI